MISKPSKYRNKRTTYNGRTFDSKKEADWAANLDMLRFATSDEERVIAITYQPKFPIIMNGEKVATYIADFDVSYKDGHREIQDVKGLKTPLYTLKKKLVEAQYRIKIIEI